MARVDYRAGFRWNDGSDHELRLPVPLLFRGKSYGRVQTRYRSMGLDQQTTHTEILAGGAEILQGRIRFSNEPTGLLDMLEAGNDGTIITYYPDLDGATENYPFLLDDFGDVTIAADGDRYGFAEWERTITMRRIDGGSFTVLVSSQLLFVTADRLPSGMTFTRASLATRRTANGEIREVNSGDLRVNYADVGGTLRPFLLVEPERTNLVPLINQLFEGWTEVSGASVTVTPTGFTIPGVSPPGTAAHITSTGGTVAGKYELTLPSATGFFSYSLWVRNDAATDLTIRAESTGVAVDTIAPGETKWVALENVESAATTKLLRFGAETPGDDLDCLAFLPQIEEGAFATSWTDGTRAAEALSFPWAFDPMPMAGYARVLLSGGNEGGERVFQIGESPDPRLLIAWSTSEQKYTLQYHNGTEAQDAFIDLAGIERGALVEFAWVLQGDGGGRLVAQVGGGTMDAALLAPPTGGLAGTWASSARYHVGSIASTLPPGDNHDRHLVVPLRTVKSTTPPDGSGDAAFLSEMRQKARAW